MAATRCLTPAPIVEKTASTSGVSRMTDSTRAVTPRVSSTAAPSGSFSLRPVVRVVPTDQIHHLEGHRAVFVGVNGDVPVEVVDEPIVLGEVATLHLVQDLLEHQGDDVLSPEREGCRDRGQ